MSNKSSLVNVAFSSAIGFVGPAIPPIVFMADVYPGPNVFRDHGEVWTVAFAGVIHRFKNSVGLRYVQFLIRNAGSYVAAKDLIHEGSRRVRARRVETLERSEITEAGLSVSDLGDAGPMIDERARGEYKRRIIELEEELEEATRIHDHALERRANEERDAILDQLRSATDHRGRIRRASAHSEKVRKAVQKRIGQAIKRLDLNDEALGKHLRASIQTGRLCRYAPLERTHWVF